MTKTQQQNAAKNHAALEQLTRLDESIEHTKRENFKHSHILDGINDPVSNYTPKSTDPLPFQTICVACDREISAEEDKQYSTVYANYSCCAEHRRLNNGRLCVNCTYDDQHGRFEE